MQFVTKGNNYLTFFGITIHSKTYLINRTSTLYLQSRNKTFYEKDRKGGYEKKYTFEEKWAHVQKTRQNYFPKEFEKLKKEFTDPKPDFVEHGDYKFLEKFREMDSLDSWVVTVDADHGEGKSTAEFVHHPHTRTGLFRGNLCTDLLKTGVQERTGYAAIRLPYKTLFGVPLAYNWNPFTHLVFQYRGDGRTYMLNIQMARFFDIMWLDTYQFLLFTRGGPYWQTAKIPFSKFAFTHRAQSQDTQCPLNLDSVKNMTISVADNNSGPFCLELDYIALYYDMYHKENFAYETYEVSTMSKLYNG